MQLTTQQLFVLAGAAFGLVLGPVAIWSAWGAWLRHRHPVDIALGLSALAWMAQLGISTATTFLGISAPAAYASEISLQLLLIGVSWFLVTIAGLKGRAVYLVLGLQAFAGSAALYWSYWGTNGQTQAHGWWISVNMAGALFWLAWIAKRVQARPDHRGWLALAGGIFGIGIALDNIWLANDPGRIESLLRHLYAAFLLVIWHLVTDHAAGERAIFADSSEFQLHTGFGKSHFDIAATAVAGERRRIAQDLHDGVASQLVTILSSLDNRAPQQQAVALALENCLLDLKMTVDAMDCGNDSVIEALGRLRYRVQHSLDKLGITMAWKVDMGVELEAVRGDRAQQVLRIAQECLANVMRHAQASAVEVVCKFVPEREHMVLEVRDNGNGIQRHPDGRPPGKGLTSMRRRAHEAGGELVISSRVGAGTRVRLTLPITSAQLLAA